LFNKFRECQFQIIINHIDIENIGIVQNEAHIALSKAMFDAHVNSNILTPGTYVNYVPYVVDKKSN